MEMERLSIFYQDDDGVYRDELGKGLKVELDINNCMYVIDKNQFEYGFLSKWKLHTSTAMLPEILFIVGRTEPCPSECMTKFFYKKNYTWKSADMVFGYPPLQDYQTRRNFHTV